MDKYQTARGSFYALEPLKLFKLANPNPAGLALPIPSHEKLNKGSCSQFPLTLTS
jgi:hypothetical protein